ncbi:siderophore-interacting protein [Planotetraspora thailandica]|uniref:Siderophore-interacting protein n=1 Tax=Planotetraspora thailandica TaxID=487172 RepID=A0A8J3Y0A2_9ACTN|nr:sigma-70 family RNA polymerase sigma factor [Planotetraspora thailandica]GII58445.1 siderophore-interacting protein [Planotetraspora thailandica]
MNDPQERFTDLYDRHYRSVLGYALMRAERETAEDVASETFLIAWRRLDEIPGPPLPWLLGVARNLLAKQRHVRHRGQALVDRIAAFTTAADHVSWDVADHVLDRQSALAALASLRDEDLEAITLATWYGLAPVEAAAVMGCSARTYNVRLHRARARLATAMRADSRPAPQRRTAASRRFLEET